MFFTMARVSAVCGLNVEDILQTSSHVTLKFREKRGRVREIPLNSTAADVLERYLRQAQLNSGPIFRSGVTKGSDELSNRKITRGVVHKLMMARLKKLDLNQKLSSHSWRGSA